METFLEAGELSPEQLAEGLSAGVAAGALFPVCFTSSTSMAGVGALAATISRLCPNPSVRGERSSADGETTRPCADDAPVSVQIFDYRGRMVRTLVEAEMQDPGLKQVPWDGRREDGTRVSSGVYFYRIQAGETVVSNKMVVLP